MLNKKRWKHFVAVMMCSALVLSAPAAYAAEEKPVVQSEVKEENTQEQKGEVKEETQEAAKTEVKEEQSDVTADIPIKEKTESPTGNNKELQNDSIVYKNAEPMKLYDDDGKETNLYKITVTDLVHYANKDKSYPRNSNRIQEANLNISDMAVDGSHFIFTPRDDLFGMDMGDWIIPDKIEGVVNGSNIEITFEYKTTVDAPSNEGGGGGSNFQNRYYDIYAQTKSGKPVDGITIYTGKNEPMECSGYIYNSDGTVKENRYLGMYGDIFNSTINGYAKLRFNNKKEDGTIEQGTPSTGSSYALERYAILNDNGNAYEDYYGSSNSYSIAFKTGTDSEDKMTVLNSNGDKIGDVLLRFPVTNSYFTSPNVDFNYTVENLAKGWDISVKSSKTEGFLDNPVTGKIMPSKLSSLMSIMVTSDTEGSDTPEPSNPKHEVTLPTGNTSLPKSEIQNLLTKNQTDDIVLKTPSGVSFTFPKGSMKLIDGKESYDFGAELITDFSKVTNTPFNKDTFAFQINYNYSGELPGNASISIPVDSKWIGQRLYYYRIMENGTYSYQMSSVVDANGNYTITQSHCSDYVATTQAPDSNGNPTPTPTKTPSTVTPQTTSPKTGDANAMWLYLALMMGAGIAVVIAKRKSIIK